MSWFSAQSPAAAAAQNFFPVTSSLSGFGELTEKDTTVRVALFYSPHLRVDAVTVVDMRNQSRLPDGDPSMVLYLGRRIFFAMPSHLVICWVLVFLHPTRSSLRDLGAP